MKKSEVFDTLFQLKTPLDYWRFGFLGHAVGDLPRGLSGKFCAYYNVIFKENRICFMPSGGGQVIDIPFTAVHIPSLNIYSENTI